MPNNNWPIKDFSILLNVVLNDYPGGKEEFYLRKFLKISFYIGTMNTSGKELAQVIEKILTYLKTLKITQSEIEDQLNYTSLSKAKNFDKYPQSVIEKKTRAELVSLLLSIYDLSYDKNTDVITRGTGNAPTEAANQKMVYIMYYYAFARETVGKAIIQIYNRKKVTIEYPMNEYWEGQYEVIENYTFIQAVKKGDTTPVKKLICLFSGTEKHGRPLLMGAYSTVKRDGFPVAGNVVLELMHTKKEIDNRLKSNVDPRIAYFLNDKVIVTETFTPNTLDNLSKDFKFIHQYAGQYKFYYRHNDKVLKGKLELLKSGSAHILISSISYQGIFKLLDSHTIKIIVKDASEFSHIVKEESDIILKTNSPLHSPFYVGSGVSNFFDSSPFYFECLALNINEVKENSSRYAKELLKI